MTGRIITNFLTDTGTTTIDDTKPHAFLNWILFDNQFNYVAASSGYRQVGDNGVLTPMCLMNLPVTSSGFLYIYTSNTTPNVAVLFDNLQVTHTRGPLLEEGHYYPGGLVMSGISDKALKSGYAENKYRYNKGSEIQNKEFADGSGLELYSTEFRSLDPQLGRWWQIDPKPDYLMSPYAAMMDNPVSINDPLGDTVRQNGFTNNQILGLINKGLKTNGKMNPFSFDKKGNLQVNQKLFNKLSTSQKDIAKNISGAITSKTTYTLNKVNLDDKAFNDSKVSVKDDNGNIVHDPTFRDMDSKGSTSPEGGNVTINIVMPETDDNIDPNMRNQQGNTLSSNPTWLVLFHELGGHGYLKYDQNDLNQAGHTVDYENRIRYFHGMELRGYDGAHPEPKNQDTNTNPDYN